MQRHFSIGGYDFHVCMEEHDHGWYIAIPNWGLCCEAAEPDNYLYNAEQMFNAAHPRCLKIQDYADEIAKAIAEEYERRI